MGNRDPLSKPRRTKFFTRKKTIEHRAASEPLVLFKQQSCLLEGTFFTTRVETEGDVFKGQEFFDLAHSMRKPETEGWRKLAGQVLPVQREGRGPPSCAAASVSNDMVGNFFAAMMVLHFLLIFLHLAIKLIDQRVHSSVKIFPNFFDENILTGQVDRNLGLLLQFRHRQDHIHVDDVIEVTGNPLELTGDVFANSRRDFKVVSTDLIFPSSRAIPINKEIMLFAAEKEPLNVLGVYPSQYFSYNNFPF